MLKTFSAYTAELDDVNLAVTEILSRLDLRSNQRKNSIGIISCHPEFISAGVVKALGEALPFDMVGIVSSAQSTFGGTGRLLLTLMMLTSDDVEFVKTVTPSILNEPGNVIANSYTAAAAAERPDNPALILPFAPLLLQNSGDEHVNVLTQVSGGVSCFGTLALDDSNDFSSCFMIADGQHYLDRMCLVLIYGDIKPKFYVANISEDRVIGKSAVVTKSHGNIIETLNGRPILDYFEGLGLKKAMEVRHGMSSLPLLVDYKDGSPPVSKIFIELTPEKHALCGGAVPENSLLQIAKGDGDDVLRTTSAVLDNILAHINEASGVLAYSCISRDMAFGANQFEEMKLFANKLQDKVPFMITCSGGEFCPTEVSGNNATNRFHNYALVACVF